jgi:hypothetical protein
MKSLPSKTDTPTPAIAPLFQGERAESVVRAVGLQQTRNMKIVYVIGCSLLLSVFGCKRETRSAQSAPAESKTISDGNSTWSLGAATMNGTNVPLSNIKLRASTNQVSK